MWRTRRERSPDRSSRHPLDHERSFSSSSSRWDSPPFARGHRSRTPEYHLRSHRHRDHYQHRDSRDYRRYEREEHHEHGRSRRPRTPESRPKLREQKDSKEYQQKYLAYLDRMESKKSRWVSPNRPSSSRNQPRRPLEDGDADDKSKEIEFSLTSKKISSATSADISALSIVEPIVEHLIIRVLEDIMYDPQPGKFKAFGTNIPISILMLFIICRPRGLRHYVGVLREENSGSLPIGLQRRFQAGLSYDQGLQNGLSSL